jgi:rhodanese-related sulfurtransferase
MIPKLIDVRTYPEFAAGHIEGSEHAPLPTLPLAAATWDRNHPLLLICKSGARSQQAHQQLTALGFTNLEVLHGGVDAWAASGKPLHTIARAPWSLERQVRIVAGSLVLLTLLLAFTVSHYFFIATALIGVGLVFAGISNICMMASVLSRFPWNRPHRVS